MRYAMLALLLTGCAMTADRFERTGSTEEDQQRTFARCRADATPAIGMGGLMGVAAYRQMIDDCMRAQGWKPKT